MHNPVISEHKRALHDLRFKWMITGVAGFIGSNLLEELLLNNQIVVGIDNFETGFQHNLEEVKRAVTPEQWLNFIFFEVDINDLDSIKPLFEGVDFVLHQAALGSVPRSIKNPLRTNEVNISGFLNVIEASKLSSVQGFVFAASSSTYGDHKALPKKEDIIGAPLSPYAITKYANELYASIYSKHYEIPTIGLRYFNVFGKRQDPDGAYAAVIPKWVGAMVKGEDVFINGDGSTTRDFCFIDNAVQANILAALNIINLKKRANIFNIAYGQANSLLALFESIRSLINKEGTSYSKDPIFRDFREGDIKDSLADISKAITVIGYNPHHDLPWFLKNLNSND
jgi:UDP-N-acetylglucosamine/UDP-N-acetylgalactosamine 4-epimerase